jgi:hypothetical protein
MPFMATCSNCQADIVFGGVSVGKLAFCSSRCRKQYDEYVAELQQAEAAYQSALARLRETPTNPEIKQETLAAGRNYAALTRRGLRSSITVFDEVALSNDIQAACAGAQVITAPAESLNIEQRLERLETLRRKGLISESEYQAKRSDLVREL